MLNFLLNYRIIILVLLSFHFCFYNSHSFALEPLPPSASYWGSIMKAPPILTNNTGNQILHFKIRNKPYILSKEAVEFVDEHLTKAKRLQSDAEVLRFASDSVTFSGAFIEAGVGTGRTVNFIAALNSRQRIYGFDSFEGLPKKWDRPDINIDVGTFGFKDKNYVPPVLLNVSLFKGLFKDVLPRFKEDILQKTPIAFLHIDSDIYESAKEVLDSLKSNIVHGTIIVFDELYNYPNYENHEWKALQEFLSETGYSVEFIAFNVEHEQVALRIISPYNL